MKRIISFILSLVILCAMLPCDNVLAKSVTDSGTCGDNATWELYDDGELVISGNGAMWDWNDSSKSPFYQIRKYIKKVTINYGITSIGNYAFYYCYSLTSVIIPGSVTSIGKYAFYNCGSLISVTIPGGVTSIGDGAFSSCSSLTSITIPDSVTSINDWTFFGCSSLTSVTIPDGVTSIGDYAFADCSSLTSVTIPDGVPSIGDCAFDGCISLTSVTIPDSVTSIGDSAFQSCISLTSVTIPGSVTSIGISAFRSCISLTSVTIPDSVTSIDEYAFYYCSGLTSVTIPDSVTFIGTNAFSVCSSLTNITVDTLNQTYSSENGVLFDKNKTTLILYPTGQSGEYIIPDSVTSIGDCAFDGCSSLTSVTIPDSVTSIGMIVFGGCSSLTSVTIPDSVTSIDYGVFWGCSSLTNVTIPDSVTSIGDSAFYGCSSLTSVTIPDSVTSIDYYAFVKCSSLTDVYYSGTEEQWNSIAIGSYNECLTNATIHYNYVSPKKEYTITFIGDYVGEQTVEKGSDAVLPVPPDGYTYAFTVNGAKWDGKNITSDIIVTVTKVSSVISFDVTFSGDTSVGFVRAALYGADGALKSLKEYPAAQNVNVVFDPGAAGAYAKIMWWNNNMQPMCDAQTIPLQ